MLHLMGTMTAGAGEFAGMSVHFDDSDGTFALQDGRVVPAGWIDHWDANSAFEWASPEGRSWLQSFMRAPGAASSDTLAGATTVRERAAVWAMCAGIPSIMLIAAIGSWPYAYYVLLRWIVCAFALMYAWYGYSTGRAWMITVFAFVAILFNPIAWVTHDHQEWVSIDLWSAAAFVLAPVLVARPRCKPRDDDAARNRVQLVFGLIGWAIFLSPVVILLADVSKWIWRLFGGQ